mmetsp:Transcript_10641/g.35213  ORF Transcript_10641/g.35213 Transcript_10641/m.35213 type:complete len:424 (-) Transcript_10641:1473-2744(-)
MELPKGLTRWLVLAICGVVAAVALPFGGKKKEEAPEEEESAASAMLAKATSILSSAVSGFFAVDFVWRLAVLLAIDAKFGLKAKVCAWSGAPDSAALLLYFLFWYVLNTKYNEYNKGAIDAVGGKTAGMTMTVSTMQLGVCAAYAGLLWLVGKNPVKLFGLQWPEAQKVPASTTDDVMKTVPVGFCAAAAHSSSVFALSGDPLFGQIVKAGEPVLSALVNTLFYGSPPTLAKACCLPVIVGGVAFASLKTDPTTGAYALKFDATALYFGLLANAFAAFKGSENKRLMSAKGIKERFGGVGNQYATTEILAFGISVPVMILKEYDMFPKFCNLCLTSPALRFNLVASGLAFYVYNELATMTIKKTSAVTASVANTAKRVIVLCWMSFVTGKALTYEQKTGAAIAIGGVLIYSVVDDIIKKIKKD